MQDNKEELKTDAEQNVSKFIEVAKQLETCFLQRRLQLSVVKPEQLVKEVRIVIFVIVCHYTVSCDIIFEGLQ